MCWGPTPQRARCRCSRRSPRRKLACPLTWRSRLSPRPLARCFCIPSTLSNPGCRPAPAMQARPHPVASRPCGASIAACLQILCAKGPQTPCILRSSSKRRWLCLPVLPRGNSRRARRSLRCSLQAPSETRRAAYFPCRPKSSSEGCRCVTQRPASCFVTEMTHSCA